MVDKATDQSIIDKSMRSVFVGNIPYEATEEKLKEIFSEVGPVISLKLVFDRESGKPKGFGFCEYKDQETALSAMRNLNGFEIGGRNLRVDNACTEKSRMEMQQLLQGPQVENPYGEHCEPEAAPERITKTVASMPPEQLFELLRQVKLCIQNNPTEAKQMLMLNPQLTYALLQVLIVSRILDPHRAVNMLFKANQMPPVFGGPGGMLKLMPQQQQQQSSQIMTGPPMPVPMPIGMSNFNHMPQPSISASGDVDLRVLGNINSGAQRPTMPESLSSLMDQRQLPNPVPAPSITDPRQRQIPPQAVNAAGASAYPTDPRRMDPRLRSAVPGAAASTSQQGTQQNATAQQLQQQAQQQQLQNRAMANCGLPVDASDKEKAALILQVLQLSEEQIAQLPPEQRNSILVLKEQIAKSTAR